MFQPLDDEHWVCGNEKGDKKKGKNTEFNESEPIADEKATGEMSQQHGIRTLTKKVLRYGQSMQWKLMNVLEAGNLITAAASTLIDWTFIAKKGKKLHSQNQIWIGVVII